MITFPRLFNRKNMKMVDTSELRSLFLKKIENPYIWAGIVCFLYVFLVSFWWPGILRPDSINQLTQAELGNLSDHHPPAMAFVWGYLNLIYAGSGSLLVFNLFFFSGAVYLFGRSVPSKWKLFFIAIPFLPPVFTYSGFVLKDVGFTFCFLFSISVLTFHTINRLKFSYFKLAILFLILFYGTAVKYQAIFVLPVLSVWAAYCLDKYRFSIITLLKSGILYGVLFFTVSIFNSYTVKTKDHSWQLVKLYDLAGMSLITHADLIPDFNKNSNFSKVLLEKHYNTTRVDEMVFPSDAILKKGKNEEERDILWNTWFEAVKAHPHAYLSHRWQIMKNQITLPPVKSIRTLKSHIEQIPESIQKMVIFLEDIGILRILQALTAFYLYIPFLFLYIFLGLYAHIRSISPYAFPLMMMNLSGLVLLSVLFMFSMAAEPRYIYLTVCCFHFSHPFFFLSLKDLYRRRIA